MGRQGFIQSPRFASAIAAAEKPVSRPIAECVRWRTVIWGCGAHPAGVNQYGNIMKTKFATTLLMIGTLLGPVAALAADSDSDRSHPKAFVKDSAITTEIKTKLAAEHLTSMGRIHVDTDMDGIVWLSGTARTQEAIEKAVSIARATEHVKSVHSDLTVKKDD
jgi:hyperosmotically inducible periplasmic protein